MGAWGYGIFDDDTAYDYVDEIDNSDNPKEIFKNASEPKQFLENSADHLQGLKDEPLEILKAINNL